MSKKLIYPKVLLVGRTNVGKSTLFNRLSSNAKSIIFPEEGITRDYISETIKWDNKKFDLIDTGGVSFQKETDPIAVQVQEKVTQLLSQAALILFVCDGKNGMTSKDRNIAKILHKNRKPVLLLINKADNKNVLEENLPEFYALGFEQILAISAIHGQGISDLLEKIISIIPEPKIETESRKPIFRIAIIGKPNVGKSSLMNLLIKKERAIVAQKAGTTREAISENFFFLQDLVQVTDTAGIRKKSKIDEKLETLMVKSTLSAVRQSDIVLLVVDSSEQKLGDQELKLLFYALEQKKSILLAFNKTDILTDYDKERLEHSIKEYDFIIKKIPLLWISCKEKKNIQKIYKELRKIWIRRTQEFDGLEVYERINEQLEAKPMYHKTILLKVFSIRPIKSNFPTFHLKVNHPQWFGPTQLGFIENILRKNFDLKGCPVQFHLKKA